MHTVSTELTVPISGKLFANLSNGNGALRPFTDDELAVAERFCQAANWHSRFMCYGLWQNGSHTDGRYSSAENFCNERLGMSYNTYKHYADAFAIELEVFGADVIEEALQTRQVPILSWTATEELRKLTSHELRLEAYEECRQLYESPTGPKKMQETNRHIKHVVARLLAPPPKPEPSAKTDKPKEENNSKSDKPKSATTTTTATTQPEPETIPMDKCADCGTDIPKGQGYCEGCIPDFGSTKTTEVKTEEPQDDELPLNEWFASLNDAQACMDNGCPPEWESGSKLACAKNLRELADWIDTLEG